MPDSLVESLAKAQAPHFRALAALFEEIDAVDQETFKIQLQYVFRFTDITPRNMSDGLGVSAMVPDRWADGRSGPHPSMQKPVFRWIARELRERADMIEDFPKDLGHPADDYLPRRFLPRRMQPRT